ncbi:N-acetylglucosamine-6-phosphate deacetylase [Duganella sp. CF402]|uniref:N-acetylglucosamine-6-phosphate deacetylase n=1 Tax=unclassified Duganella TaxID=2636909 RepID=UPI0008CC8D78|nr:MULTISPECIES: N-acetylglucosamine-6-phosphate deacetylase [unclassified Duganella]RZT11318.1 N-acetylglucosamine-6-phosphate deacetylase [Duganella sp. BK701]SEK70644.1 N-acetylglucosamine-6-phosphate deacetylase [Duganella sp. CF402]
MKISGRILTPNGWVQGHLHHASDISHIEADAAAPADQWILPGFIDLHVHGAGGTDIMEGGDAARRVARLHARHGTTTLLGTTMTAPPQEIERALQGLARAIAAPDPDSAQILGVHLEGPFLNCKRLGAQPPLVSTGTLEQVRRWNDIAPIKVLTLAPEIPGHLQLIAQLSALGIRVQAGHSAGSYEDGVAALEAGLAGFTHLFNGMSGLSHRAPGIVGAALAHGDFAEVIPDLQHVQPGALRAAMRAIPRLYAVTDATAATGMPDGEYMLGSQRVMKCMGCVRLVLGDSLAGSALTMDQALRNLVSLGLSLPDASARVSRYPAEYLGLEDRGVLAAGQRADIVVLDADLQVRKVIVGGHAISLQQGVQEHALA